MPLSAAFCFLSIVSPVSQLSSFLVLGPFNSGGRTPCPTDPVAYVLAKRTFKTPAVGEGLTLADGSKLTWKEGKANKEGWLEGEAMNGGYAFATFDADKDKTMLLDASGHSMVYVNGVPRAGDPYGFGIVKLPIEVRKGKNSLLFSVGRGRMKAQVEDLASEVTLRMDDPTLPDAIVGEPQAWLCSVLVMNATKQTFHGRVRGVLSSKSGVWNKVTVAPMTVKKVSFECADFAPEKVGTLPLQVELASESSERPISSQKFVLEVKKPDQTHKRTFRSSVDGSVQYYGVQPSNQPGAKALVLSLHGAGVEASGQAASYGQKPWCNIVCPTNGRPFGFDWEDWGRINALDALANAKKVFKPDSDRVYLTGHSMGGHGTWSIGFNRPDLFAAIAPCAGWISFWSYAGAADWKQPDEVEKILRRAANPSDTLLMLDNSKSFGVYIQHGDADDNVPVGQAREMRERLGKFHRDFDWHEEPGQSHWFDTDPEAGANVQDYAPLFDFLSRHRLQGVADKRLWDFTTVNLATADMAANLRILQQERSALPSHLKVRTYADSSFEQVESSNVNALSVSGLPGNSQFKLVLDSQELSCDATNGPQTYTKVGGKWSLASQNVDSRATNSTLKTAMGRTLVYGTHGDETTRKWSFEKARYDAETWWYRGNGSCELVADTDFDWKSEQGRSAVTLYGNSETNSAIAQFLEGQSEAELVCKNSNLNIAGHDYHGDFGLLTLSKLKNSPSSSVAIIGGTTLEGMRSIERSPIFLSGVHFPDVFVVTPETLKIGSKGVKLAGFYGPNWEVDSSEFASRD